MKRKKILITIAILTVLLILGSSIAFSLHYGAFPPFIPIITYQHYDDFKVEEVVSIEVYDLRGTDHYGGFHETEDSVYILPESQKTTFLNDLSTIQFGSGFLIFLIPVAYDPSFLFDDWVIRINHSDGSYTFISCDGYGESYDKNNKLIESNHFSCDCDEWYELIAKFVPEELLEKKITHN